MQGQNLPLGNTQIRAVCGSHLFGTNVEGSDRDYVSIFIADARRLALRQYIHAVEESSGGSAKNTASDTDEKRYDLVHFIHQVLDGQPYALELLHTPANCIVSSTPIWDFVMSNKDKLITNKMGAFSGYCRRQAAKYSAKGEKFNELTSVIEAIKSRSLGDMKFLHSLVETGIFDNKQHFSVELRRNAPESGELLLYGPDCSFPLNRRLDEVLPVLDTKLAKFGERTRAAAKNDGTDLKAYYHALRVIWEQEEYMTTGAITLPCPRASELLRVRNMEFTRPYIESWIEAELVRVNELPNTLPEPSALFWDEWLADVYIQHTAHQLRFTQSPLFSPFQGE